MGDQVARPLLEALKGRYPAPLMLDHKPGAGGRIAAEFVKRAAPDGSTLLAAPSSVMALYPHTYGSRLSYDPLADFVPVVPLAAYTLSLTVGPAVPASVKSVADLVAWLKAHPRCHGETLTRPQEIPGAFARALASRLPAVLDCRTVFEPHPCMPAFGSMNRYGFDALTGAPGAAPSNELGPTPAAAR